MHEILVRFSTGIKGEEPERNADADQRSMKSIKALPLKPISAAESRFSEVATGERARSNRFGRLGKKEAEAIPLLTGL
jgi:hypothetical protein